jgi:hypothetical protein
VISLAVASALAAEPPSAQPVTPEENVVHLAVQGVSVERTIAEFMDICFRPGLNATDVQKAVQASEFGYARQQDNDNPNSFTWSSNRAYLVLNVSPQLSQCALSIGSIQSRTGKQLLAMLKPVVETETGRSVEENDDAFYLQWSDPVSGYVERITLGRASNNPQQAIWYVLDKTAPGVREKLDALQPSKSSSSK